MSKDKEKSEIVVIFDDAKRLAALVKETDELLEDKDQLEKERERLRELLE